MRVGASPAGAPPLRRAPVTSGASRPAPPRVPTGPWRLGVGAPLAGIALSMALVVWPMFVHAAGVWATVDAFGYGFLVPPLALALVWRRWRTVRASAGRGAWGGLLVVLGALALALVATRAHVNALAGLAVVPLLWGVVVTLWGWRSGRVLAFPIGFLAFGLGVYTGALNQVGFVLQGVTATGAGTLGHWLGLSVVREGLVLRAPGFAFVVAEACSGMNSLLALFTLAALWGYLVPGALPPRLAVVASVLPLAVVANVARVTLVLLVAAGFGQDAALGVFHEASSLLLFGIAVGGLLLVGRGLGCHAPRLVG